MKLWGPYKAANINGGHYFLINVEDFNKDTWAQLLQNRTKVLSAIGQFLNMVKT